MYHDFFGRSTLTSHGVHHGDRVVRVAPDNLGRSTLGKPGKVPNGKLHKNARQEPRSCHPRLKLHRSLAECAVNDTQKVQAHTHKDRYQAVTCCRSQRWMFRTSYQSRILKQQVVVVHDEVSGPEYPCCQLGSNLPHCRPRVQH